MNSFKYLLRFFAIAPCVWPAPVVATPLTRASKASVATLAIVLLLSCSALHGAVMLSNLPNSNLGGSTIGATDWKAVVFTTGSQPTLLSTVTLGLNPNPTDASVPMTQNVNVSLYSVTGNTPNTLLATTGLTPVNMQARQGLYSFNFIAGTAMEASTAYALVISSDANTIKWGSNGSADNAPTDSGFTYNRFVLTSDSGASWTDSLAVNNAFSLAVVPEPSSYILLFVSSLGMLAARRR